MKTITQIINLIDFKNTVTKEHDNAPFTAKDAKVIHRLFDMLQAIFPAFRNAWATQELFDNAKIEWMKAFRQANLHDSKAIECGLNKFRLLSCPFVPTPGRFISMCKPSAEDIGLKPPETAFVEACEQSHPTASKTFSHVTVKLARDLTGVFFLSTNPKSKTYPIFEKNYKQCIEMFLEDKNLYQIDVDSPAKKQELKEPKNIEKFRHLNNSKSAFEAMKKMLS